MDPYDEYDDPDQLQGIFDDCEEKWDSEYEDALTDRMHRQAEYEAKTNNPPYIPSSPISSLAKQYKEGELILSDFNQKKLEMEEIKKSKELNAKLVSIIKNIFINFILVFIVIAVCDIGRGLIYMLVDINYSRHFTYSGYDLIRMVLYFIFKTILNTMHLQFWYYFIIIIQQCQFYQKKLEIQKIKKFKELNAILISTIKNLIINFILVFIVIAVCDIGRRHLYMLVDINYFRHFTYSGYDLIRMVLYFIFKTILNTLHLQFWYYFIIIIQQCQFSQICYCFIRILLRMSNWLTRIKIKDR